MLMVKIPSHGIILLDEGHIIKNPKTKRAKSLLEIPSGHRIITSGTLVQNNLKELWALFSFCCPELLGDKKEFKLKYESAILRATEKNATDREKHIGANVAKELRDCIEPYFLRRLKSQVFLDNEATKSTGLPKKNDIIVWLRLTQCQRQLYEEFISSKLVLSSSKGRGWLLAALTEATTSQGYKFLRIDGTTKIGDREKIVNDFQEGKGPSIFLLTSQVGGLGLTLTKADRVIVVDPAWNPSADDQSVDRAYRIEQKKDVLVYRLMTCGTIEEKIYKMQVFKGGLFKTATEHKEQMRYFSKQDLCEFLSLPEKGFDVSLTQQQLNKEHAQDHIMNDTLKKEFEFLKGQDIAGVSHHNLLYSKTAVTPLLQDHDEVQRA